MDSAHFWLESGPHRDRVALCHFLILSQVLSIDYRRVRVRNFQNHSFINIIDHSRIDEGVSEQNMQNEQQKKHGFVCIAVAEKKYVSFK